MKKILIIIYTVLLNSAFSFSQSGKSCESLPAVFISYEQAVSLVKSADFAISESVDTRKSSWIRGLEYYSCDGQDGFLIMQTDGKSYIHQNVPIEIWDELKNADSFGGYYNEVLKHNYRIAIE